MAKARPCRQCREMFSPRGQGRPPVLCGACRAEKAHREDDGGPEPEFWARMRDEIRVRAGEAFEDVGHELHEGGVS